MRERNILIIEDSASLVRILEIYLQKLGFNILFAYTGEEGVRKVFSNDIDIVLVDIGLPDMNGLTVIQKIRKIDEKKPVIVISKSCDLNNEILAYKSGATLFHKKPVSLKLLEVQIKNFMPKEKEDEIIRLGELDINTEDQSLRKGNSKIALTSKELKFLLTLIKNKGYICERDYLLDKLTFNGDLKLTTSIDTLVCRVRKKLNEVGEERLIETVTHRGYRICNSNRKSKG